jgi:PncC family amidohydrolase
MASEPLVRLAERVGAAARRRSATIATAESCTGGLVADALTEIPGSSDYLRGGVVAYANEVKESLLGVEAATLAAHGAVSAQTARAMALGVRMRLGTTHAVATTGIAGPDGGSEAKPVGLTYVAVAHPDGCEVERHLWSGDRRSNKEETAAAALALLAGVLER